MLDPLQVGGQHLRIIGRQRPRLGDLDLSAVAAVLHPGAADLDTLALLEMNQRADERDRRPVGLSGVEHRPAGLGVRVAHEADRDLGLKA